MQSPILHVARVRFSLRVINNLRVHVLGYLPGEAHSYTDNFLRVETREVAKNRVWTKGGVSDVNSNIDPNSAYLELFKMSVRSSTSCATIHRMFKWGP